MLGHELARLGERRVGGLAVARHVAQDAGALAVQGNLGRRLRGRLHARELGERANLHTGQRAQARQLFELGDQIGRPGVLRRRRQGLAQRLERARRSPSAARSGAHRRPPAIAPHPYRPDR